MAPSGEGNVTLFISKLSPFAQRVQLALVEKGIPFKPVDVDLANKPKELLEANPIYGKVPTLVHDGNSVCESLVILEYLDEAWPETKSLLPKDAVAKSKARFWADYMYKGLENVQQLFLTQSTAQEREAAMAKMSKFLQTIEGTMVDFSADGPFFMGDEVGYLDVVLAPWASWDAVLTTHVKAPLPGPDQLPRLNKWVKAIKEQRAYKEVLPTDEKVLELFNSAMKKRAEAGVAYEG